MSWQDCQILNLSEISESPVAPSSEDENSSLLLEWIVDNSFFKSEVFESTLEISGQKFFRFSITATDTEGTEYNGYGRSKNRLSAASIAAGEAIERYVAKKIFKSNTPFFAKHQVAISDTEISVSTAKQATALPTSGFHSSNGWAVYFSLKTAIEKSAIEALERHTLLYSYLRDGWNGFSTDAKVPFKGQELMPCISRFSFGGFGAGIVATEGKEFPGHTFGYLCDDSKTIMGSKKWLNAFFESFGQWESLALDSTLPENANFLAKYQMHFLMAPREKIGANQTEDKIQNVSDINANILIMDLKKALDLPVPMFAAFSFGGNLIPLFFKQKLSANELKSLQQTLATWQLPSELPEVHPIL